MERELEREKKKKTIRLGKETKKFLCQVNNGAHVNNKHDGRMRKSRDDRTERVSY